MKDRYNYVKTYIENESNSGCKLISTQYINAHAKLDIQCKCGNIFNISFNTFKNGQMQCRKCGIALRNKSKKLTYEYVKKYIEIESGTGYKLISECYKNNYTPLLLQCNNGHTFEMCFANFQQGRKCSFCTGVKRQRDTEFLKQEIFSLVNDEYDLLSEYMGVKTKITLRHNKCGHIWDINVSSFLSGVRCPKCSHRSYAKTTSEFKDEVYKLVGNEYEVVEEYKNCKTHVKIKHCECNNQYEVLPNNFLRGRRCPFCGQSKGEQKIRRWLEINNIKFIQEYDKFIGLSSNKGNPLRFDFAILSINDIVLLVEFDGQQHFDWIKGWQTKEDFETLKSHDKLKNEYCKNNNIPLLRISYWDFDKIEDILQTELHKNNLLKEVINL